MQDSFSCLWRAVVSIDRKSKGGKNGKADGQRRLRTASKRRSKTPCPRRVDRAWTGRCHENIDIRSCEASAVHITRSFAPPPGPPLPDPVAQRSVGRLFSFSDPSGEKRGRQRKKKVGPRVHANACGSRNEVNRAVLFFFFHTPPPPFPFHLRPQEPKKKKQKGNRDALCASLYPKPRRPPS